MKKILYSTLALVVLLTMILVGCSKPEPTPTPTPTPTPAPTPAPAQVFEMKLILWTPATSPSYSLAWEPFMQKLEEVTNNRIKLTVYPGGSLAKSDQQYDFIATGSADMGPLLTAFEPGQFPISDTLSLPFLGINSAKQGGTVHWNLYEKYQAAMDSHYKGVKILCAFMSGPAVFYSAKNLFVLWKISKE